VGQLAFTTGMDVTPHDRHDAGQDHAGENTDDQEFCKFHE
jgi:hypothetical protein